MVPVVFPLITAYCCLFLLVSVYFTTGKPCACQAAMPPSRQETSAKPAFLSCASALAERVPVWQTTITGLGSSDSQTKFGINAGAGFDFGLGKAKLFAEGRFHAIMKGTVDPTTGNEKAAYMIPLTVGLRF